ncbi:hypothetical protein ACJIZ3_003131 [Penstemon smallii]|uniref:Uncharacterized protein n=1 Tax=Penstemon smallii TaxID=265156 RepID=A0ABD3UB95_9LAMI
MDSIRNTVSYCCVSKGGRVLYTYNSGDHEVENLAALCLEMTPPYHQWYFQTMNKKTFGFLMDDGYVYFAIVNESLGNSRFLKFLHMLRDEFRKLGKKGATKNVSSLNSLCLQEQLLPVVNHSITPSPSNNANGHIEGTKAPLLGKPGKQEKKKVKDHHVIGVRDIEMEEHRRSTDRGLTIESRGLDSNNQGTSSASPLRTRVKPSSQVLQKKWCRQVRIILAIDAVICIVLFVIWLVICHGTECIR